MTARNRRDKTLEKDIAGLLEKRGQGGLRKTEVRRLLGIENPEHARRFNATLRKMVHSGQIQQRKRGRYVAGSQHTGVTGRLSVHHRGFGFVTPEQGGPDIFIPPQGLNIALSGDMVEVGLVEEDERGLSGRVQRVLERGRHEMTGEFVVQDDTFFVRPLRRDYPEYIPVHTDQCEQDNKQAGHGDWVILRLIHPESPHHTLRGVLVRQLNTCQNLTDDLEAIIAEYSLQPPYSKEDRRTAKHIEPRDTPRQSVEGVPVLTIDPEDAKDFDDAISRHPSPNPDTAVVGVHIADVAAYIQPEDDLDIKAATRGFTAYLPGRTLPMLPHELAAERCSLRKDVPSLAHTVMLFISVSTGRVLKHERFHSRVTVTERLDYREVQDRFDGHKTRPWRPKTAETIDDLRTLAQTMRHWRTEHEHFLELETTEVRVVCQENPPVIKGLRREESNEAHQLVEEFMLAANVAVGEELQKLELPGIYRIHPEPRQRDLKDFRHWTRSALGLRPGHLRSRGAINSFLGSVANQNLRDIVNNAFLRELPRASYSEKMEPHFGLGKACYAHFTSPIRRYPDLVVHQQLWQYDNRQASRTLDNCAEIAKNCSALEMTNDEAYFAALDRLKLRYVQQVRSSGESPTFEGLVARLMPEGALVDIHELGLYGLLPKESLGNERFDFSKQRQELRGKRSGTTVRCGDTVFVTVHKADIIKGVLVLKFAGFRLPQESDA